MIMARIFFSDFLSNDIDRCNTTVNAYRNGDCEIVEGYVKNGTVKSYAQIQQRHL